MDAHALFDKVFTSNRKTRRITGIVLCSITFAALVTVMIMVPSTENIVIAGIFAALNAISIFLNIRVLISIKTQKIQKAQ